MSLNPAGRQQIPWSGQYGLNTEVEPADLPEGLSPDNQDQSFVPGKSGTRPAVQRVLNNTLGSGLAVTYLKSFVQPNGDPLNLELTADGNMNMQDINNSPNTTTVPFAVTNGVYASSITAFNREYFAFHDGAVAKDIPRSFDGVNWYRLTQDACATNTMAAADAATTTIPITQIVPKPQVNISTITLGSGFATVVTNSPHGLAVNDHILISGNTIFQWNGTWQVATVPNPSSITFDTNATGLDVGTGGQIIPLTVTVTTTVANDLISGETITITGNSDPNYDNSQGGVTTVTVGLAGGAASLFYPNADSNGGAFPWCFGSEGPNLPGTIGSTFNFPSDCTLMWDPNTDIGGTNLPGFPVYNHGEQNGNGMWLPGINASGSYNGHQYLWNGTGSSNGHISASFKKDYAAVTTGVITVSAPGNVTFKVVHKEGVIIGIGGGALYVSGPQNNPRTQTKTASKGYPLIYSNNASTEFYHVSVFNSTFVVNFPAAGSYPIEIDYAQWHHSRPTFALLWENALSQFVPLQAGSVAFATPATWTVGNVLSSTQFQFDAVYAVGTGLGGTITVGGLLSPGSHQMVCFFQTDTDSFTAPSTPVSWNSAGAKRVVVNNAPIGPPNVKARWFAFTGAQGSNYFTIPVPARDPQTGQQVSTSTVINDNTSTTATFDFSDNTLFDTVAIDITGNNLFAQVTLGPCANITQYSNRLAVWGDTNKIQNLRSMGFEGGIPSPGSTTPLWWNTSANQGGQLVAGEFGFAWQITGNGTSAPRGMITQPFFQDYLFDPIGTPSTQYTFECFAYAQFGSAQGSIIAEIYSPTGGGSLATATIPVSTLGVGLTNGAFMSANFSAMTPTVIPADTVLRYYTVSTVIGQNIVIDETMVVYTQQPVVPGQMRFSYAFNPEAFDGVTGVRGIEYPETVLEAKILRDNLYIVSQGHLSRTQDNGVGEPSTWTNYTVSDKAGGLSLRSFDLGEGWGVYAGNSGLYMFAGGEPIKISQEVQKLWDAIDPTLQQNVWVKVDLQNRRIYIGAPITLYPPTGATFTPESCNKLLVIDFRELNSSSMIENAPPLHISMTGRMLSSDLTRKWTVWNLPMNCAEIMYLPGGTQQVCLGSGLGNGLIGVGPPPSPEPEMESYGFGNFYKLNDEKYADDDYGTIGVFNGESPLTYKQWLVSGIKTPASPLGTRPPLPATWRPQRSYYMTYLSPSHEQEQQLQIGSQRKLYEYLEVFATGVGTFSMLPFINTIENSTNRPAAARSFDLNQVWDLEWPLNMKAQRLSLLFYANPLGVIPPVPVITISPTTASLSTFNTQQFSYHLEGTKSLSVIWSCSGGSINSSGHYTAPGTAGTYTVTVTSVESPLTHATAVVTVHGGYDGA